MSFCSAVVKNNNNQVEKTSEVIAVQKILIKLSLSHFDYFKCVCLLSAGYKLNCSADMRKLKQTPY